MTTAILDQVQQLVDQLSPLEQVKLLEYLTPRIARAVVQQPGAAVTNTQYQEAWADLFRVGEAIMASDADDGPTLTSAVAAQANCTLITLDNEHLARLTGIVPTRTPGDALIDLTPSAPDENPE